MTTPHNPNWRDEAETTDDAGAASETPHGASDRVLDDTRAEAHDVLGRGAVFDERVKAAKLTGRVGNFLAADLLGCAIPVISWLVDTRHLVNWGKQGDPLYELENLRRVYIENPVSICDKHKTSLSVFSNPDSDGIDLFASSDPVLDEDSEHRQNSDEGSRDADFDEIPAVESSDEIPVLNSSNPESDEGLEHRQNSPEASRDAGKPHEEGHTETDHDHHGAVPTPPSVPTRIKTFLTDGPVRKWVYGASVLATNGVTAAAAAAGTQGLIDGVFGQGYVEGMLMEGGDAWTTAGGLVGTLGLPAATLAAQRLFARRNRKIARGDMERELATLAHRVRGERADIEGFIQDFEKHTVQPTRRETRLIDTLEEKDLAGIMAHHAHCSPAEVPNLQYDEAYAWHCFARFSHACRHMLEHPETMTKREIEVLQYFHIEAMDAETASEADKMEALKKLWEVSLAYGRFIGHEHRKANEKVLDTQLGIAALTSAPLLGVAAPLIAGSLAAAQRLYVMANNPGELELDAHGHVQVTTRIGLHGNDERRLLQREVFRRELKEGELRDDHKYWMNLMRFDDHVLHDPSIRSDEELGLRLEQSVLEELAGAKIPGSPVKEEDIRQAKEDYEAEKTRLRELWTKLSTLEREKKKIDANIKEAEEIIGSSASNDSKVKAKLQKKRYETERDSVQTGITELKIEISEEDGQEARTEKAKRKWERLKTSSTTSLSLASASVNVFTIGAYPETAEEKKARADLAAKERRLATEKHNLAVSDYGKKLGAATKQEIKTLKTALDTVVGYVEASKNDPLLAKPRAFDRATALSAGFALIQDFKREVDDAKTHFDASKTTEAPEGDPKRKEKYEKAKQKHDDMLVIQLANAQAAYDDATRVSADSYLVEDLKRAMDDAKDAFDGSKTAASPDGNEKLKKVYEDAKRKHDAIAPFVRLTESVKEDADAIAKAEKGRREQLEKAFEAIREAFAFKVKEEWKHIEEHRKHGIGGRILGAMGDTAADAGKNLAIGTMKLAGAAVSIPATVLATYAALASSPLIGFELGGTIASGMAPWLGTLCTVGAIGGGMAYLVNAVKGAPAGLLQWVFRQFGDKAGEKKSHGHGHGHDDAHH